MYTSVIHVTQRALFKTMTHIQRLFPCILNSSPIPLRNLIRFLTASEVCENILKNLLSVLQLFAISCSKHFTFHSAKPL